MLHPVERGFLAAIYHLDRASRQIYPGEAYQEIDKQRKEICEGCPLFIAGSCNPQTFPTTESDYNVPVITVQGEGVKTADCKLRMY